jgi:LacI family transcriptional regulator
MRDVARVAGVSLKTVSRVVNGETTVAPELATRVRSAVESLDYRPHLGASMLRRNDRRTRTIGLLLEDVADPFSAALHRAVEDAARERGMHVLAGSLDEDPQRERELARAFAQRQADGLIVAPTDSDQSYLSSVAPTPIVFVDRPGTGFAADSVLTSNTAGAAEAVRHLLAYGHRRIAHLGDDPRIWTARARRQGYRDAMTAAGQPTIEVTGLRDQASVEAAVDALLGRPDPPTALFPAQNLITIAVLRALRRRGGDRTVAVVGFDDFPQADLLEPGVTVIAQDPPAIGRAAARALFDRLDGLTGPAREILVPTKLIARGSGEIF